MKIIYTKPDCKPASVSIFTIPKPFIGHVGLIQFNAIASWRQLAPQVEIFLFGDEPGTKEICQELDLIHVRDIDRNEYGTPLLNGVFAEICDRAQHEIIVYLNADIILTSDFLTAIQSVEEQLQDYLVIGRRWNIDLNHRLDFNSDWESDLNQLVQQDGSLADYDCKDYFVFPKHLFSEIPRFAVGRGYWDTWMVTQALDNNYPVVDCSLSITAIHQNHPYIHIKGGRNEAYMGREAQINKSLGNVNRPGNIACSTYQLKPKELRETPQISVIIFIEDDSRETEKAILSVLIQDYDDCEIIVVDRRKNNSLIHNLEVYQKQIKYYSLAAKDKVDAYIYGLEKASGELILYLDGKSILQPKILTQLVECFTKEASTLDVLLAGYKTHDKGHIAESLPWNDFPNLEKLYFEQSQVKESLLNKSVFIFRTKRVKFLANHCSNHESKITRILSRLIFKRGCRVTWFKEIVANAYI